MILSMKSENNLHLLRKSIWKRKEKSDDNDDTHNNTNFVHERERESERVSMLDAMEKNLLANYLTL